MELLDMVPAHAIALRLYSLPAAAAAMGSLCAWLVAALAAAAVGLWRIRAVGASKAIVGVRSGSPLAGEKQAQDTAPPLSPPAIDEAQPEAARAEPAQPASSPSVVEPSTPSKVRLTAYYGVSGHDDGVIDGVRTNCADADDDVAHEEGADGEVETMVLRRTASFTSSGRRSAAPWGEREIAVRWRGDLGWYRHLDLSVLDGSVVRLWDGDLTASPRGRRRRAARLDFQLSF